MIFFKILNGGHWPNFKQINNNTTIEVLKDKMHGSNNI